jgi:cyclopropane-fatty-acyl-phospholipid synthase
MSSIDQTSTADRATSISAPPSRRRDRLLQRLFGHLRHGRLRVQTPEGAEFEWGGEAPGPEAQLILRRWRTLWRGALGGDIGMADAWIDGDWTSPDLTAVIRLAARNSQPSSQRAIEGTASLAAFQRLRHLLRANTRRGSRRNIEKHYDLGNDFFGAWLDSDMIYSSALWTAPGLSLGEAQQAKLDRVASLARLSGGEKVLEIGCGWGALATRLASAGAHVTGVTLSPSQLAAAQARAARLGLAERCDLRLMDYREAAGPFDRIVSIEMIEAVGEAYLPLYFDVLSQALKPDGRVVLQAITIAEDRFDTYRRDTDFIQKHIFPGGFLPSKSLLAKEAARVGLKIVHAENFGPSYARTLAEWRRRFEAAWPRIAAQGFDQNFRRLWDYYLCYCEAGFLEEAIDVGLYVLEREG